VDSAQSERLGFAVRATLVMHDCSTMTDAMKALSRDARESTFTVGLVQAENAALAHDARVRKALREASVELGQLHAHYLPKCGGGCPCLVLAEECEKLARDAPPQDAAQARGGQPS
jgi:hypothetical protein